MHPVSWNRFPCTGSSHYQNAQQKKVVSVTLLYNAVGSNCAHRSWGWGADGAPRGHSGCPW